MNHLPQISDAEWQIMQVLWDKSPMTFSEISKVLADSNNWSPKTIQTLIGRLVKKNAVGFEQEDRIYKYYPRIAERECKRFESEFFLKKVYRGSLNMMVANFVAEKKLTRQEIDELKRILDKTDN